MVKKITKAILQKREKRKNKRELKQKWNLLRKEVIELQNNKCFLCKKYNSKLNIHHIIDRRIKETAYDKLNLVGSCPMCHRLSPLAVHQTSIYFSEMLRIADNERFYYLLSKLKQW